MHWDHEPTPSPSQEGNGHDADRCLFPSWEGLGVGRFMESRCPNWLVIKKGSEWQIEQVDTPTFRVSRLLTCYDVRQKSPRAANVIRTAAFQAAARAARSNARKPDCASLPA